MRKICNFGDGGESLWQVAEDGDFVKVFCIKDENGEILNIGEKVCDKLVPCLKDGDGVGLLSPRYTEKVDWLKETGLSYEPKGFYFYDDCPHEVLESFGLVNPQVIAVEDEVLPETYVYELTKECEDSREDKRSGKTHIEKVMELVHLRGTQTHRLGMIDKELQDLEKEFNTKIQELKHEQNKVLEVIDTYHKTIEILLQRGENE